MANGISRGSDWGFYFLTTESQFIVEKVCKYVYELDSLSVALSLNTGKQEPMREWYLQYVTKDITNNLLNNKWKINFTCSLAFYFYYKSFIKKVLQRF